MMTLNRYLLVGKDHAPWLVTLAKLEFKWVIRGSLLFSALINIGHGWEYQAENDLALTLYIGSKFGKYSVYSIANGNSYSDYPEANKSQAFFIYSIVYFVINFGVFFILNTTIEVKIVRRMQKVLREKRERMQKMNASKPSAIALTGAYKPFQADEDMKKAEYEDGKKEREVIKMVVLNGFLNFIFRAPDLLFWLEYKNILSTIFIYRPLNDSLSGYNTPGLLTLIADISYLTYVVTFSTNFLIFYKFNKNFKEAVVFF
jgi:hypothetical protein